MGRVAVIGDVGGHPDQLVAALRWLGARDDDLRLPEDLTVVQVGDLVDRGPDSVGVLRLVGRILDEQPDRWVQLAGNHDAQYLPDGVVFWRDPLADAGPLREWWADGRMQVAAAVRLGGTEDVLLTHAGLTVDAWHTLGEPMTATTAALLLNERPEALIWLDEAFSNAALHGPLWAEAGPELYGPWLDYYAGGGFVPFDQVHGHSMVVDFANEAWRCVGRIRQRATADWAARHVRVRIGGRVFTGVDPKHGRTGAATWQPLVWPDAEILVRPAALAVG
jgi:hypothetical protein